MKANRLPEIERVVVASVEVDTLGMLFRAPANQTAVDACPDQVNREGEVSRTVDDFGGGDLSFSQQLFPVHRRDGAWRFAPRPAESQLVEARPGPHDHAEAARRNLQVQLPLVPFLDLIEQGRLIGNEAREDVEPPG